MRNLHSNDHPLFLSQEPDIILMASELKPEYFQRAKPFPYMQFFYGLTILSSGLPKKDINLAPMMSLYDFSFWLLFITSIAILAALLSRARILSPSQINASRYLSSIWLLFEPYICSHSLRSLLRRHRRFNLSKYMLVGMWMGAMLPIMEMAKGQIYCSLMNQPEIFVDSVARAIRAHEVEGVDLQIHQRVVHSCQEDMQYLGEGDALRAEYMKLIEIRSESESKQKNLIGK